MTQNAMTVSDCSFRIPAMKASLAALLQQDVLDMYELALPACNDVALGCPSSTNKAVAVYAHAEDIQRQSALLYPVTLSYLIFGLTVLICKSMQQPFLCDLPWRPHLF
jgi:hypothetical protein